MDDNRGIFFIGKESVMMRKWQILEFDDKPYYAFVPENEIPLEEDMIPEYPENQETSDYSKKVSKIKSTYDDQVSDSHSIYEQEMDYNNEEQLEQVEYLEIPDINPITRNDSNKENEGDDSLDDVYQVRVDGSMITIEKLAENLLASNTFQKKPENEIEKHVEYLDDEEEELSDLFLEEDEASVSKIKNSRKPTQKTDKFSSSALKCKACSETFGSNLAFRKHVAWSHKKKVCIQEDGAYICSVCDYRTLKKSSFAAHLERKHETWTTKRPSSLFFPCGACGFVCSSKHSLQSHFIRKHTDKFEHQCKFCAKKFKVKGDLTNHVRFHHKEKPISCDVCGKICQNSGSLYVHQKWAHYKPKFECHICHRRMVTQENLDQHLVMQHEKREKIVCAECGKTFTKKDSFKRHMAVHTGSKPHSCLICLKHFARRSQLRQHLLIHTGKKPFVCDICGKGFTQKPGLICHRKIHPGNHPPLPVMPIGDLVKELTGEHLQNNEIQETEDDPDFLDGAEILDGQEFLEGEEILQVEEAVEEEEILQDQEFLESQKVFYEQEIHGDQKFHVDQEFLDDQQFHGTLGIQEIAEDQEIEIGP